VTQGSLQRHAALRLADGVASSDVVVLGSGVAGLTAALSLVPRRVTVLTKGPLTSGSSRWAQGGIAAAMAPENGPDQHAADTLIAGAGLCDDTVVETLTADAPEHIRRLIAWGVRFDRDGHGDLQLGREGAHSVRRVLHAGGDATGAELVRALVQALVGEQRLRGRIGVCEDTFAEDLVVEDGRVVGVLARHADGRTVLHRAGAVVLATGGCGQLWSKTTNPAEVTGDGLAMAARAGATLADLAFMQFHPTALDVVALGVEATGSSLPLLTEVLRGEGAVLVDARGERFMTAIDPRAELASRDIVARAIWRLQTAGEPVYLDARNAVGKDFPRRFPTVWHHCRQHRLDPRKERIPVTPAAHYAMAGVAVDEAGRSSLDGLWACGEVTASGLHGANRLASNSLIEGLVYGARVAEDIAGRALELGRFSRHCVVIRETSTSGVEQTPAAVRRQIQQLAWQHLGLERDRQGLEVILARVDTLASSLPAPVSEAGNLLTVGRLLAAGALARQESRGAHLRTDFPGTRPGFATRTFWTYARSAGRLPLALAREAVCGSFCATDAAVSDAAMGDPRIGYQEIA